MSRQRVTGATARSLRAWLVPAWLVVTGIGATAPAQTPPQPAVPAPQAATSAQPGSAIALVRRMLVAERTLEVVGATSEHIALPGVRADASHTGFALPVAVTPELLARAFTASLGTPALVAGRRVEVLQLHGKGPLTPDWTFWVDGLTGVRLGYRVTDSSGQVVAEGRYTTVRAIRARQAPHALPSPTRPAALKLEHLLNPAALPQGYVPVGLKRTEVGAAHVPALRLTFWDGLDAMVVLVYRRQAQPPAADSAHVASEQVGRFTVSAIGPAPKAALEAWLKRLAAGPLKRLDPAAAFGGATSP
ncbi:MAG: hypothetical protein P8Z81_09905 [Deinococcales bacterium]